MSGEYHVSKSRVASLEEETRTVIEEARMVLPAEKGTVSRRFVEIASHLLTLAMFPLMLGMTADLFLVARLVLENVELSIAIAAAVVFVFFGLWYLFPWIKRQLIRGGSNPVRKE